MQEQIKILTNEKWKVERRGSGQKCLVVAAFFALGAIGMWLGKGYLPDSIENYMIATAVANAVFYVSVGIHRLFEQVDSRYEVSEQEIRFTQDGARIVLGFDEIQRAIPRMGRKTGIYVEDKKGEVYWLSGRGIAGEEIRKLLEVLSKDVSEMKPMDGVVWKENKVELFGMLLVSAIFFLLPGVLCVCV